MSPRGAELECVAIKHGLVDAASTEESKLREQLFAAIRDAAILEDDEVAVQGGWPYEALKCLAARELLKLQDLVRNSSAAMVTEGTPDT